MTDILFVIFEYKQGSLSLNFYGYLNGAYILVLGPLNRKTERNV